MCETVIVQIQWTKKMLKEGKMGNFWKVASYKKWSALTSKIVLFCVWAEVCLITFM